MSSYEKEMEEVHVAKFNQSIMEKAAMESGFDDPKEIHKSSYACGFQTGAKWQASRLTIDKIISILEDHSSTTDSGATSVLESVHKEDWPKAAKEILALLKGENEK